MEEGYKNKREIAKWLGISCSTVLRWEADGKLPPAWRPCDKITLFDFAKCKEYIARYQNSSTSASA